MTLTINVSEMSDFFKIGDKIRIGDENKVAAITGISSPSTLEVQEIMNDEQLRERYPALRKAWNRYTKAVGDFEEVTFPDAGLDNPVINAAWKNYESVKRLCK